MPWPFAPLASRERARSGSASGRRTAACPRGASRPRSRRGCWQPGDWTAGSSRRTGTRTPSSRSPARCSAASSPCRPGVSAGRLVRHRLGVYEAQINGAVVGDHVLAPGWTSYDHRLRYQTFDVTALLQEGRNAIGAILGDGWYRGRLGFGGGRRNIYGDRLALLAQLEIEYADGTAERVVTDEAWRARDRADPGQRHLRRRDLRRPPGAGRLVRARLTTTATGPACGRWRGTWRPWSRRPGPPVRPHRDRVAPVAITTSPSGRTIVDFGQNLVGRLRLTVSGAGRADDHAAPRRGARGRRAVHAAAALRRGHRPLHPGAAAGRRPGSRASPSTASATPRSTAGRASCSLPAGRDPRRRLPLRHGAHRLVRVLRPAGQPAPRERRLEHARQLPRHPDRLPAARRAPGLDRRHPGLRADRLLPLRRGRLPPVLAGRPGRRAGGRGRRRALCRAQRPGGAGLARGGVGRCRGHRALGALPALRRRGHPGRPVRQHARPGSIRSPAWPARRGCGTRASSSATGSTRTRRPTSPGDARTAPDIVATAYFARSAELVGPGRGRARPATRTQPATPPWPPRSERPSRASTSRRPGAWSATPRPPTRWRLQFALLPDAPSSGSGPASGWPSWCAAAATASAPASSARR